MNTKQEINETEVLNHIEHQLLNPKFQNNLNTIIVSLLSNKKVTNMTRDEIEKKIIDIEYIRNIEDEILTTICKKFCIKKENIQGKYHSQPIKNEVKSGNLTVSITKKQTLPPIVKKEMDNFKLLNFLIDEILLSTSYKPSFESIISDLNGFSIDLIMNHDKVISLIDKINSYLVYCSENEMYEVENINQFYSKLSETKNHVFNIKLCIGYMNYLYILTKKFFKTLFDITKFYKLYINLKLINHMITKLYGNIFISHKIPSDYIKSLIELFLKIILYNYDEKNSIYICDKAFSSKNNQNSNNEKNNLVPTTEIDINLNEEFGISTNYMLFLLLLIDFDLPSLKIIFRANAFRLEILKYFDYFKYLPFINYNLSIESFRKKYCFLWIHYGILNDFGTKHIINKKFLLFSWFYLKISFLGLVIRYKSLKNKYFSYFYSQTKNFTCFNLFQNLLTFMTRILLIIDGELLNSIQMNNDNDNNKNLLEGYELLIFEKRQNEEMVYLCKEVLCDFIIYCSDKSCIKKKKEYFDKISCTTIVSNDVILGSIYDDISLAFQEKIFSN